MKSDSLLVLATIILAGCLQSEGEKFSCEEKEGATKSGSNWVYAIDTTGFLFATKYPIAYNLEIFDSYLNQINNSGDSLDSAKLVSLYEDENGFRRVWFSWLPIDKKGDAIKSGCYKARLTVNALQPLSDGDIPNNPKTKIVMEWIFLYIRGQTP